MMQTISYGIVAAVLLFLAGSGCGDGCQKSGDKILGQPCQSPSSGSGAKYLCPEGYFCKYDKGDNMSDPTALGECAAMDLYKPCMNVTLCGSADYTPKCETVNETAYCDWYQTSLRCRCEGPGPFVEGDADGEVKTPTTTK